MAYYFQKVKSFLMESGEQEEWLEEGRDEGGDKSEAPGNIIKIPSEEIMEEYIVQNGIINNQKNLSPIPTQTQSDSAYLRRQRAYDDDDEVVDHIPTSGKESPEASVPGTSFDVRMTQEYHWIDDSESVDDDDIGTEEVQAMKQILDRHALDEDTSSGFISDSGDEFADAIDGILSNDLKESLVEDSRLKNVGAEAVAGCSSSLPGTSAIDKTAQDELPSSEQKLRDYQNVLAERAKNENIIACLPTGSGKTVVGMKVMLAYKEQVKQGKKIFFFANTIPLLKQQAEVIKKCTNYKTGIMHGRNKCDWVKRWQEDSKLFDVFVVIPAVFTNLLNAGIVKFRDIALFVIDECHNAVGEDAMSLIMRRYRNIQKEDPQCPLPRVVGLTATIIKRNLKNSNVESGIKLVEKILCCTAVTYNEEHEEEVLSNSTQATLKIVYHDDLQTSSESLDYLDLLGTPEMLILNAIERIPRSSAKGMEQKIVENQNATDKKEFYLFFTKLLADMKKIYFSIGPFGLMLTAYHKLQSFQTILSYQERNIHLYFTSILNKIMFKCHRQLKKAETFEELKSVLSPRTQALLEILGGYKNNLSEFCGIIFVERRSEAHCLCALLDELAKRFPVEWGFVKAGVAIGTNKQGTDASKYRQTNRLQGEVVLGFRLGQFNVLLATSVIQEGIDVRNCSFVVRFDRVNQYPSFIQSMGRARKVNAKFYVLLSRSEQSSGETLIQKFAMVKSCIDTNLLLQGKNPDLSRNVEIDKEDLKRERKIDMLCSVRLCPKKSPESPSVTLHASIMLVNRYCALLKNSMPELKKTGVSFRSLSYIERIESRNKPEDELNDLYRAYVKMPDKGPVSGVIVGPSKQGKVFAKRAAYLLVCEKLYAAGELDERLLPHITGEKCD